MVQDKDLPDGTGDEFKYLVEQAQLQVEMANKFDSLTWENLLTKKFYQALAESDESLLSAALHDLANTAEEWAEAIRFRHLTDEV